MRRLYGDRHGRWSGSHKPLPYRMGTSPFFLKAEESELAPCWATELAREWQDEEDRFNRGRWV
jgi:hypothetical protein